MTIFWRSHLGTWLWLPGLCALALQASGTALQSPESIVTTAVAASEQRAREHGHEHVSVQVKPLDQRLRLPLCGGPLSSHISSSSQVLGAVNVQIACKLPKPWTIYIRTTVAAQRPVPVLTRPLARRSIVSAGDIKLVMQPVESVSNGLIFDPEQIIGMELVRSLDEGSTIRVNQLRPPKVIKRGQEVMLISSLNGLEVRIKGKAMRDAASGERVTVTNLSSGKKIEGIARSDGTVSVQ